MIKEMHRRSIFGIMILVLILVVIQIAPGLKHRIKCNKVALDLINGQISPKLLLVHSGNDVFLSLDNKLLDDKNCPNIDYFSALVFYWNKEFHEAEVLFRNVYSDIHSNNIYLLHLSDSLFMMGEKERAIELAIGEIPSIYYIHQAHQACQNGDHTDLMKSLMYINSLGVADDTNPYVNLGYCLWDQGFYGLGLKQWRIALSLDPNSPELRDLVVRSLIIKPDRTDVEVQEAEIMLRESVESNPWPASWYRLALLLSETDRKFESGIVIDKGIQYLQSITDRNHTKGEIYYQLGLLYYLKGETKRSIGIFNTAIENSSRNDSFFFDIWLALGRAYIKTGELEEAGNIFNYVITESQENILNNEELAIAKQYSKH